METLAIINYRIGWDLTKHRGFIFLQSADGTWSKDPLIVKDPAEFSIISNLLRYERPLFFNRKKWTFQTGSEPVGDEE